ncbi:MAG: ClpX C4-type zinc finger protein [Pyrinomonadaceae bacterium]
MNGKLNEATNLPDELRFVVDIVASITLGNYNSAIESFVSGATNLVSSSASVPNEKWLFVISALENAIRYKLAIEGVVPAETSSLAGEGAEPTCNFCGKYQSAVEQIIGGPGVYICNGCVALCNRTLTEPKG